MTLKNVLLHKMVKKNLAAAADRVQTTYGAIGAKGLVGRFV